MTKNNFHFDGFGIRVEVDHSHLLNFNFNDDSFVNSDSMWDGEGRLLTKEEDYEFLLQNYISYVEILTLFPYSFHWKIVAYKEFTDIETDGFYLKIIEAIEISEGDIDDLKSSIKRDEIKDKIKLFIDFNLLKLGEGGDYESKKIDILRNMRIGDFLNEIEKGDIQILADVLKEEYETIFESTVYEHEEKDRCLERTRQFNLKKTNNFFNFRDLREEERSEIIRLTKTATEKIKHRKDKNKKARDYASSLGIVSESIRDLVELIDQYDEWRKTIKDLDI